MESRLFNLESFYRRNRRVLIWLIFFFLLYLLRDFFGLIFLIYVLALISGRAARLCHIYLHLPRRPAIILVYAMFLGVLGLFAGFIVPRVMREANVLVKNLGQIEDTVFEVKNNLLADYPLANNALMLYLEGLVSKTEDLEASGAPQAMPSTQPITRKGAAVQEERIVKLFVSQQSEQIRAKAPQVLKMLYRGTLTMLLALLFSFLIMMDLARLSKDIQSLRLSRLHDFYEQTAQPVVRFAWVVGRAIEAQAIIAVMNTALTFAGLLALRVPSLAMLSVIVFLCSFIPVLGVFISTVPIVLVGLNSGGVNVALAVIILIIIIHMIEAYLLNPLVYGHQMKLNPVLVLIILLVGHHAFGLWGMLLGVPVTYYFIHDVFGVPMWTRIAGETTLTKTASSSSSEVEDKI